MEVGPSDGFESSAPDYQIQDVWLEVTVVEAGGDQITIKQFGKLKEIPTEQIAPEKPINGFADPVYPAHENSPYTKLDELVQELKEVADAGR
jgi:hypothetical protein